MSKILIVEDDRSLGFVICDNLQQAGYSVNLIATGMEGLKEAKTGNYDLIILDVMLPELDGFKMAEQIRSNDSKIPILFLSAKSMVEDRLEGLRKGGDDYLTKPFSMEELLLKIRVFLKRTASTDKRDSYEIGTYQFVPAELMLRYGDTEQKLTAKESQLLELLCRKQDAVLKREEILEAIWGSNDYFLGRSMDVFISKLRKYLAHDPRISISNYHGVGFQLKVQDS